MLHSIYATLGISYLLYTLRTLLALPLALDNIIHEYLKVTTVPLDRHEIEVLLR
jgi:hypothetical protein